MTLHELATKGDIDTFQTISLDSFDINGKNEHGHTPLMLAAHHGHREFSRYLIGLGADVNSIDNSGHSVLMNAAKRGHHEIIKHLIEKGAAINYTNSEGQTALDLAQMSGRGESVSVIESFQKPEAFSLIDTLAQWVSQLKFKRKECDCMP